MRCHLMQTFDKIYVLDLHGNANKKEVTPEGKPDKNIFDIRQGVAVVVGIKHKKKEAANLLMFFIKNYGALVNPNIQRSEKKSIAEMNFKQLAPRAPYFMFYDVNLDALDHYDKGFSVSEFLPRQSTGIISARDELVVDVSKSELASRLNDFLAPSQTADQVRAKYFGSRKAGKYPKGDSRGWSLAEKRPVLAEKDTSVSIRKINYRPLDTRWICYDPDIVDWPRLETMERFNDGQNIALLSPRMTADDFSPLVSNLIISNKTGSRYDQTYFFSPLPLPRRTGPRPNPPDQL